MSLGLGWQCPPRFLPEMCPLPLSQGGGWEHGRKKERALLLADLAVRGGGGLSRQPPGHQPQEPKQGRARLCSQRSEPGLSKEGPEPSSLGVPVPQALTVSRAGTLCAVFYVSVPH